MLTFLTDERPKVMKTKKRSLENSMRKVHTSKTVTLLLAVSFLALGAGASSVTIDSVRQRWPWNNKFDITYTVVDGQTLTEDGAGDVYCKLVFNATIGGQSYVIDGVTNIGASASSGQHTVTWTPPQSFRVKDLNCTMTAQLLSSDAPSGDDYMVVDLDTGVVSYEGLLYSQERSNQRYKAAQYKESKLVLRKVPRGAYYTVEKTWNTEYVYYAGVYLVTRAQYNKFVPSKTWHFSTAAGQTSGYKPADMVGYDLVRAGTSDPAMAIPAIDTASGTSFLQLLNCKTGNTYAFDLPTVVMAEIARRAGTTTKYPWGNSANPAYAAYTGNHEGTTSEVDAHLPNNWGLHDTLSNLWELCLDSSDFKNSIPDSAFTPANGASAYRMISGGGIYSEALQESGAKYYGTRNDTVHSAVQNWMSFRVYCIIK